jgi:hypothetical protein
VSRARLRMRKLTGNRSGAASTGSLPKDVACDSNGTGFLATVKEIQVISPGGKKEASLPVDYSPLSVAYSSKAQVAVGAQDGQIRLYSKDLQVSGTLDKSRSAVTALAFSPDGSLLAAGEASGKILVYDVASKEIKISHWVFHTWVNHFAALPYLCESSGRIASIKFSPDGQFAVSGSLDESVYVCASNGATPGHLLTSAAGSVAKPAKKVAIKVRLRPASSLALSARRTHMRAVSMPSRGSQTSGSHRPGPTPASAFSTSPCQPDPSKKNLCPISTHRYTLQCPDNLFTKRTSCRQRRCAPMSSRQTCTQSRRYQADTRRRWLVKRQQGPTCATGRTELPLRVVRQSEGQLREAHEIAEDVGDEGRDDAGGPEEEVRGVPPKDGGVRELKGCGRNQLRLCETDKGTH